MSDTTQPSPGGTVLYGVPKVEYGLSGITPYPMCVKAVANYLGEDVDYDFIMCACGAAFRLTWDTTSWFAGNVDVAFTFDDETKGYRLGIEALGRSFGLLERGADTTKEAYFAFVKQQIDNGVPCIATGIIGPPEACIVTGYRGEALLGWNFFQNDMDFAAGARFDECGYFIAERWWENECTQHAMSMGEITGRRASPREVLETAAQVLSGRRHKQYAKGLLAYDAWKRALADDDQFPQGAVLPLLAERTMCHGDAMDCLADGRHNAARYMGKLAHRIPEHSALCLKAKECFERVAGCVFKMAEALGGWERGEAQMRALAKPDVRGRLCALIDQCRDADEKALLAIREILAAMQGMRV